MEHDSKRVYLHLIAVMIVGTVLVSGMYYSAFVSGAGEKEFKRAHEAVHKATSFRVRQGSASPMWRTEMLAEVVCPDNLHISKTVEALTDTANSYSFEDALVGGAWYHMDGKTRVWRAAGSAYESEFMYTCLLLGRDDDAPPLPPFQQMIRSTSISKGKMKTVNGVECRVWIARFPFKDGPFEDEEICIGEDHLPRERRVGGSIYTYWDWNVAFTVKRPLVVAAEE